ncbi:MAG: DUF4922 domain-containing protein [Tannerella sp.]|jgi:hypothetical protein|nr:DUF4922 domain-containing protein [Tannerella sp.]
MSVNSIRIKEFLYSQLEDWDLARNNYAALGNVRTKVFDFGDFKIKVQFNPARIVSSGAKVDEKSIRERRCFLCAKHRPAEQRSIPCNDYEILVNPYPVFPEHFTIASLEHAEQLIYGRFSAMLDFARLLEGYVIFYNGPKCGASAPDHAHFQAGPKDFFPIVHYCGYDAQTPRKEGVVIRSKSRESVVSSFFQLYGMLEIRTGDKEPMMNILAWHEKDEWVTVVYPRKKHRPDCYYAQGEDGILISPAAVDLGGMFVMPLLKDFEKITKEEIEKILREICMTEEETGFLSVNRVRSIHTCSAYNP